MSGLSVLIATRNRANRLERTLIDFCALHDPAVPWELLIVDNGSTDNTANLVKTFADRLPLRYVYEGQPGKVHALNTGIPQARYDLVLMTDDDITPGESWLRAYAEAAQSHPDHSFFGGDIYADIVDVKVPGWAKDREGCALDWVAWNWIIKPENPSFAGGNVAYRSYLFIDYGLFPLYLGHVGKKLAGGEEPWFERRLKRAGEKPLYVPDATVKHRLRQQEFAVLHVLRRTWYSTAIIAQISCDLNFSAKIQLAIIAQSIAQTPLVLLRLVGAMLRLDRGRTVYQAVEMISLSAKIYTYSRYTLAHYLSTRTNDRGLQDRRT